MCGRLNITDHAGIIELLTELGIDPWPERSPRFNVAPTQTLDVVIEEDEPAHASMAWGLDTTIQGKKRLVFNARDDKVWTSPMWRGLIKSRRALVPVTGFYEWVRKNKKPVAAYYMAPARARAMWFAGLYRPGDSPQVSIITTSANEAMSDIHHRMPVILGTANEARAWLTESEPESLEALMTPADENALTFTEVSDYVNKSTNEGPQCVVPVD